MQMSLPELQEVFDDIYHQPKGRAREVTFTCSSMADYIAARNGGAGPARTPREIGSALGRYRKKRDRKYAVSCEGYGTAAVWKVCAVEGRPAINRRHTTDNHRRYVAEDAVRREFEDLKHEVLPALKMNGAPQAEIDYAINAFEVHGVNRLQDGGYSHPAAIEDMGGYAHRLRLIA